MSKKKNIFNGERNERYDYLVTKEQPLSYTTESFQKVIINLDYANIDQKIKVIQFTSTLASEGKSTFVSNLSYLLSQKNKKVVLLDMDLRKPKMQRVFNVPNKDGLTDYLAGKISYEKLIKHSADFGFDFIVAGEKTNAVVNVLESSKMKELIVKLREDYDYVLLDAPPVIAVSDALYISKNADGIIFIVAQGVAKKALVKEAIQTLKHNNVHIIGTVLTQVNLKSGAYGYGYDYTYKYEE
ncbi:MAG: CpsD/CapB family tyrosine-protein kinase [Acholeplasmataceae bacterium]|jgi:capsular exopolysaccharide synthesis family protein|nr:CpsD/CapB family tyrosine-protein kinase [Acholeplasmataceae bacterium]